MAASSVVFKRTANSKLQWSKTLSEYYFNFATHSYFGTISKDVLSINVSRSVIIKYKSYFKISIIENAICLPAKRLIHLERFPWLWTFVPHRMHPDQHQQLPSLSSNDVGKCWSSSKVLSLGKTANINAVCSSDSLWRGQKRRRKWGSRWRLTTNQKTNRTKPSWTVC
jgi:hypothetical protein